MRRSKSSSVTQQAGGQPETCSTLSQRRGSEREKREEEMRKWLGKKIKLDMKRHSLKRAQKANDSDRGQVTYFYFIGCAFRLEKKQNTLI